MAEHIDEKEIKKQREYIYKIKELNRRFAAKHGRMPLANTETYGCQQNENDTERIRGILKEADFDFCENADRAML